MYQDSIMNTHTNKQKFKKLTNSKKYLTNSSSTQMVQQNRLINNQKPSIVLKTTNILIYWGGT